VAGWDDFISLNGSDGTGGIVEEDTRGSQSNTVGGFVKSTYADVPGAQNDATDFAGSFNTNGISGLATLQSNAMARTLADRRKCVDIFSVSGLANYKNTVQAYERYAVAGGEGKSTGIDALSMELYVGGVKAGVSVYMPNAGSATTANPWTYLRLNLEHILFTWGQGARDGHFGVLPAEIVSGLQRVLVSPVICRGQWMVYSMAGTALGVDGDTF
jgi:hypothetical protein